MAGTPNGEAQAFRDLPVVGFYCQAASWASSPAGRCWGPPTRGVLAE